MVINPPSEEEDFLPLATFPQFIDCLISCVDALSINNSGLNVREDDEPWDLNALAEEDDEPWDLNALAEEDFERLTVYLVPDVPYEGTGSNLAEASLPRNLVLKPSQTLTDGLGVWSTEYIPKRTRFGPFKGEFFTKESVPITANRKYFWRVYDQDEQFYYIDGFDVNKSNWMRFVNPAYTSDSQNLIACQYEMNIYFYTVKPILPNTELLVWYCKEFAERLNYPLTGELMHQELIEECLDQVPPSDQGYHSNDYHDDAFTPPEDSSDDDNDSYVLDL